MSQNREPRTELPVVARNDLTLTGTLTATELADVLALCRVAVPIKKGTAVKTRPVEFDDEQFLDRLRADAARHEAVAAARNANPPSPEMIDAQAAAAAERLRATVQNYIDTIGPLVVRTKKPTE